MDELKDDLQSKIADYSKMAESGKNEKQFFSFFPYFYMHRLANEPKPSRPVCILLRMMQLCQGLHFAAKIYQQIWVAILAKKRLKETAYRNVEFLHSFLRRHFAGKPVVESRNVGRLLRLEESYEKISICRTNSYFIALRREK